MAGKLTYASSYGHFGHLPRAQKFRGRKIFKIWIEFQDFYINVLHHFYCIYFNTVNTNEKVKAELFLKVLSNTQKLSQTWKTY